MDTSLDSDAAFDAAISQQESLAIELASDLGSDLEEERDAIAKAMAASNVLAAFRSGAPGTVFDSTKVPSGWVLVSNCSELHFDTGFENVTLESLPSPLTKHADKLREWLDRPQRDISPANVQAVVFTSFANALSEPVYVAAEGPSSLALAEIALLKSSMTPDISIVAQRQVLIVLGEPGGLEDDLVRDVALLMAHELKTLELDEDTFNNLITQANNNDPLPWVQIGNVWFFLLLQPSIAELKGAADVFLGRMCSNLSIVFCGHGTADGEFLLSGDTVISGGDIFHIIHDEYQSIDAYHPTCEILFNCCYAQNLALSVAIAADSIRQDHQQHTNFNLLSALYTVALNDLPPPEWPDDAGANNNADDEVDVTNVIQGPQDRQQARLTKWRATELEDRIVGLDALDLSDVQPGSRQYETKQRSRQRTAATDGEAAGTTSTGSLEVDDDDLFADTSELDDSGPAFVTFDAADAEMVRVFEYLAGPVPLICDTNGTIRVAPLGWNEIPPFGALVEVVSVDQRCNYENVLAWLDDFVPANVGSYTFSRTPLFGELSEEASEVAREGLFEQEPSVFLYNVKQGDAALVALPVHDPDNSMVHILIDGGYATQAKPWFEHGVGGLDTLHALVCTHSDRDHISGLVHLSKSVRNLPNLRIDFTMVTAAAKYARSSRPSDVKSVIEMGRGRLVDLARARFPVDRLRRAWGENIGVYVIHPTTVGDADVRSWLHKDSGSSRQYNDNSLALLIVSLKTGDPDKWVSMLFTGDAPHEHLAAGMREVYNNMANDNHKLAISEEGGILVVDYMDLPHHGSLKDCGPDDKNVLDGDTLFRAIQARNYGWSCAGDRESYSGTMNQVTLARICNAHEATRVYTDVFFTFPEWHQKRLLREIINGVSDPASDYVATHFLGDDSPCHWITFD